MYLKYAEIGESEKSLDIVDLIVRKYYENVDVRCLLDEICKYYRKGDEESVRALKNFSNNYDMYLNVVTRFGTETNETSKILETLRPELLELANEYVRIIEGTTREGRKKHLRII